MTGALKTFEEAFVPHIGGAIGESHLDLHRDHERRIASLEGDADDFRTRLDALEAPTGTAPPDLATLEDLDRALAEWIDGGRPTQRTQKLFDEIRLLLGDLSGRLRAVERKQAHPLIVGTYSDSVPCATGDAEFPDPAVDGDELAHHKATIQRLEQSVADHVRRQNALEAVLELILHSGAGYAAKVASLGLWIARTPAGGTVRAVASTGGS